MDFSIPQPTQELLDKVSVFLEQELYPLEKLAHEQTFREMLPVLREKQAKVREMGLWTPQIPKKHGGVGLSFMEFAMLGEILAKSPYGHFVFNGQAPDAGNMEVLIDCGSEEQQKKWLEPLVEGKIRSCFSMTEPDHPGSNPVWMGTTAVRDGDEYVINGRKWFTTAADGAAFAIVMVVTNPDAAPHQRASQIIVPTDTPGFNLVRNISCMGEPGDDWLSHAEVSYEDCRVPVENLIGNEGDGFTIAQKRLGPGRIHHCMRWIGVAERSLDLMCSYAASREIAPGKPLATSQVIQHRIADSRAEINAARLMVLHAGWKIDNEGTKAARIEISTIKYYVANMMMRVIDHALQAHGALGISDDTVLSHFYRHERASRIYDGPDEVHRNVVARQILKSYGVTNK